ncbi:MAG: helix-turn-helix transcriptional regulator [Oscillospiraceae bacterium]|nr:helix-turn-helix transcriptional regulator [Oscillospiraceae bacterium]
MGKRSVKEDKSIYQLAREAKELTRAEAAEKLGFSESKLERIESYKSFVQPEDVCQMVKVYGCEKLYNQYCSCECAIGKRNTLEIEVTDLPSVTLKILSLLNKLEEDKDDLIEISADGTISEDEKEQFNQIKDNLEKMEISIQALKLWINQQEQNKSLNK